MINEGDIVLADFSSADKTKKRKSRALVIGLSQSTGNVVAACIIPRIRQSVPGQFTEVISRSDLEQGTLKGNFVILADAIVTLEPQKTRKVARLKKNKLEKILRLFSHFAGYSYYRSISSAKKQNYIPVSGKILDEKELFRMFDASLDQWLTAGRFNDEFEKKFAKFLGVKFALTVNSGSSANLLALSALTSHELGERRIKHGDEIITIAAAFPTTVMPIMQNNLIPVFVDIEPGTYNIDIQQIEDAVSEKTRAIFIAHTLGNPFRIDDVLRICRKYDLFLIEDSCDALGSRYAKRNSSTAGYTGSFGDIATFSFYPAHHMTMGEGGAVVTGSRELNRILLSMRDWGRDCWCPTGKDNTCGKRFTQQHGRLPAGYDHKYVYSHSGYNLKITDWQAAIGLAQLQKLPTLLRQRKRNFKLLYEGLKQFEKYLILPMALKKSEAAWFGFPLTLKNSTLYNRTELARFLEKKGIGTRQLFAGNILKQPVFLNNNIRMRIRDSKNLLSGRLLETNYKMLPNTDMVMERTLLIGTWPGISGKDIKYIIKTFKEFFS